MIFFIALPVFFSNPGIIVQIWLTHQSYNHLKQLPLLIYHQIYMMRGCQPSGLSSWEFFSIKTLRLLYIDSSIGSQIRLKHSFVKVVYAWQHSVHFHLCFFLMAFGGPLEDCPSPASGPGRLYSCWSLNIWRKKIKFTKFITKHLSNLAVTGGGVKWTMLEKIKYSES